MSPESIAEWLDDTSKHFVYIRIARVACPLFSCLSPLADSRGNLVGYKSFNRNLRNELLNERSSTA